MLPELRDKYCDHNPMYTDGSKVLDRVAAAAISDQYQCHMRLPGDASIYTAELQALKMAFHLTLSSKEFIIFSEFNLV